MKKIIVTGGNGMVGLALVEEIKRKYPECQVYHPNSKELNLCDKDLVRDYFAWITNSEDSEDTVDLVIHLAAKVGGVKANTRYVNDFFTQNIQMNSNVLDSCLEFKVKKTVSLLSTCVYPDEKYVNYPLTEDQLELGPPHESNFGYAYAKRMLYIHSKAIRQQHGGNFICAIPNNLFGPNDLFDIENGHVIPSLMHRIWKAKEQNIKGIEIWGDGTPLREFTYSKDIAKILLILAKEYNKNEPVNIGNTKEITIKELAYKLKEYLGYEGKLIFNPNSAHIGQHRKPSSNKKLLENTSWSDSNYTDFDIALKETCDWFIEKYPNIRGI